MTNHTIVESIYAIRHKDSGAFIRVNRKTCWASVAAAKSSWKADYRLKGLFSEQDDYEIVDLLSELSISHGQARTYSKIVDMLKERSEEKQHA